MQIGPTRLPIELLQVIFRHAVTSQLDTNPRCAAELQLVSRETQSWLLPSLFRVLVVYWPYFGTYTTPSLTFFFRLLANPCAPPRAFVRHVIILHGPSSAEDIKASHSTDRESWAVDTVAVEGRACIKRLQLLRLAPRRVIIPGTLYGLRDFVNAHWDSPRESTVGIDEVRMVWPIQTRGPLGQEHPDEESLQMTHQQQLRMIEYSQRHSRQWPSEFHVRRSFLLHVRPCKDQDIQRTVEVVQKLFRGPGLDIVLALQDPRSLRNAEGLAWTQRSLCVALNSALDDGTNVSSRLRVQLENSAIRPVTCKEYIGALREEWEAEFISERISLEAALSKLL